MDPTSFADRHIGPSAAEIDKMLAALGYGSLDELAAAAVPDVIKSTDGLSLDPVSEDESLRLLRELAGRNQVMT
jgi:glycine dehydrogenase